MELRHLTYFTTAAELGSISKAAAVLNMTQPSLSRQVKELERDVGYELFERTSRGVSLTPAGLGFFRHLKVIFAQLERIPEVLHTASQDRELVRIGVPQGMPHDWFLGLATAIRRDLPAVTLSLHEATTEEQRQLLQSRLIDFALLHFDAPEAETVLLLQQEMGLAVSPTSPLARRDELTFEDLAGLKVMAHAAGEINAEETRLRTAAAAAGIEARWVFRRFSEHSGLIVSTAEVDAVLVTSASAGRHLPDWVWVPMRAVDTRGEALGTQTWLAWVPPMGTFLDKVITVIVAANRHSQPGQWDQRVGDLPVGAPPPHASNA